MNEYNRIKRDNRFFDRLAHREQEYRIGDIGFKIILFHSLNHVRNITPDLHRQTTLAISLIEKGSVEYFNSQWNLMDITGNSFCRINFPGRLIPEIHIINAGRYYVEQNRKIRTVAVNQKGYIVDDFSPYEVHIYRIELIPKHRNYK